ncbi:MAG TPA: TrpB-like pyridoxal phosphate-dependent enzyme [Candidatus Acidoferrales bacterium]|jgi:tryptophan synthase beta chain|nr:TrpB-like pyridoxal phosphate-dependent enzyme [Candidatus Acidoferrales bacterium]
MSMKDLKILLDEDEMPRRWYNIQADLPVKLPPKLHPVTREPATDDDMLALFSRSLVEQEGAKNRYIDIPDEILEAYFRLGRPTPLYRAKRLENYLKTPARIYYKREDVSFAGSHKPNTAIAQAYYNMIDGSEGLVTETGAGQWGTALALGCSMFGLTCKVFMVRVSYDQKPARKTLMRLYGAEVIPSPSTLTQSGQKALAANPDHPGSLGLAISEAAETSLAAEKTKYSLGSVLEHVLLHQTIVGEETVAQLKQADENPDVMIGCVGGGSNFSGFSYPLLGEHIRNANGTRFIGVEPSGCPTLTKGEYRYDLGDAAGFAPLVKMYTLGHDFVPSPIHAGGLRYHGDAQSLSLLKNLGYVDAVSYEQLQTFEAGVLFTRTEGICPAPETSHAIKAVVDEAVKCKQTGEAKVIVFNFSGHGLLDLAGYEKFLNGELKNGNSS